MNGIYQGGLYNVQNPNVLLVPLYYQPVPEMCVQHL